MNYEQPRTFTDDMMVDTALSLASSDGWDAVTRDRVADELGCARSLVTFRWGSIDRLRAATMRAAVEREILPIVARGLADQHPDAMAAPRDLKLKALGTML